MSVQISEDDGSLEITALIGWPQRCLYGVLALFPLLAPYQLIFGVAWRSFWNPFFALAAAVSIGAVSVSVLLVLMAFGGRNRRTIVDTKARTVSTWEWSPVAREKTRMHPLEALTRLEVRVHPWSDGDSYSLDFEWVEGDRFPVVSSLSRKEIEGYKATVDTFLLRD